MDIPKRKAKDENESLKKKDMTQNTQIRNEEGKYAEQTEKRFIDTNAEEVQQLNITLYCTI